MSDIKSWSSAAAGNNAAAPNGFPEGMAPSGVNDAAREVMAAVRRWYEDAEWINPGHAPTYASATSFTIATDVTAIYAAGRRLKLTDASTLYGTVSASSYTPPNTTITVTLDSGLLTAALSAVAVGILKPANVSIPTVPVANGGTGSTTAAAARTALAVLGTVGGSLTGALNEAKGADIASAATTDIGAATGNYVEVTGTTTITALGTVQAGTRRIVRFAGALTLTHDATSLILPGGANIATTAGDIAEFVSLGSGNWICTRYMRASGMPLLALSALQYQEQRASGTSGPSYTASGWRTVPFSTEVADAGGFGAVASNQITLAAGTYKFSVSVSVRLNTSTAAQIRARLQNVTDATTVVQGPQATSQTASDRNISVPVGVQGVFTITASKAFEVQVYATQDTAAVPAMSTGAVEVYSDALFEKIA